MRASVLGIDGGNSKADVALATSDGRLLGARRIHTISHQAVALDNGMARLARAVGELAAETGSSLAMPIAHICVGALAGADYASDIRLLTGALEGLGLAHTTLVVNDTIGALRASASRPWGLALVCGQGINAAAVAPDGRTAGFPAVGDIAGDWGGAGAIGMAALAAAIRGRDGRGPRTSLERRVPAHFGLSRSGAVTRAMYDGRIAERRVAELAPVVFSAAGAGDAVARSILDRLVDELVGMAAALIRRLHLARLDLEVVLAGGVFRTRDETFYAALEAGIRRVAPHAQLVRSTWPPVAGAVLLGLDRLAGGETDPAVANQLRAALAAWDAGVHHHPATG